MAALRIGEILIEKKLINADQLQHALEKQMQSGHFLGAILVDLGYVSEDDLLRILAEQFNTRFVSLEHVRVNPSVIRMVSKSLCEEYTFLPIDMRSNVLLIAVANPLDMWPMSVLQDRFNLSEVQIVLAKKDDIKTAIRKIYN